jgi:DNA-binding transcriptional LysR family regulator
MMAKARDSVNATKETDEDDVVTSPRPSVRELEVLHAVIATRKTTAAAQILGISQPAISRAISSLEARLQRPLFHRDGGRLMPTADAFALDAEASPIFESLKRLETWPNTVGIGTTMRIATTHTLAHAFLTPLLARFVAIEPDVRIHLDIGRTLEALMAVADGTADVGIVDSHMQHAGVRFEPFRQSVAHCVIPLGHPLINREEIVPADLERIPMVALSKKFSARAQLDRVFANEGLQATVLYEATTVMMLADMVRAGMGVAVINPFPVAYIIGSGVEFRPFRPEVEYEASFIFPSTGANLPIARRFVDFIRSEQMMLQPASSEGAMPQLATPDVPAYHESPSVLPPLPALPDDATWG